MYDIARLSIKFATKCITQTCCARVDGWVVAMDVVSVHATSLLWRPEYKTRLFHLGKGCDPEGPCLALAIRRRVLILHELARVELFFYRLAY